MKLNICHLYPDVLNLYGDSGNIRCLLRRLEWRGIEAAVTELPIGENTDFADFDLFFIGGGQDFQQEVLLEDLHSGKDKKIISAIEEGKAFLAISEGYQLLGQYYVSSSGEKFDFVGALPLHTEASPNRLIGNYMFHCGQESGGNIVVGFENHGAKTYLHSDATPLGTVISGFGNNGEDKTEGIRYKNVFGTYSHGPLLPKNPEFADMLLATALQLRYPDAELPPLEDRLESTAHTYMESRLRT